MSRRLLQRILVGLGLWLAAGGAWADYKTDYQDGIEAAEKGNWAEVRRLMNAALAKESKPVARMRTYGTNFIPYVPHYWLGLANARLGDCAAALQAFDNPGSRSIVAGIPAQAGEMASQRSRCEQQMLAQQNKPVEPPLPAVETPPVQPPVTEPKPVVVAQNPPATETRPTTTTPPAPAAVALPEARIAPAKAALAKVDTQIGSIDRQLKAAPLVGTGDARELTKDLDALRSQRQKTGASLERARSGGDGKLLGSVETDAAKLGRDLAMLGERVQSAGVGLAQAQEATALEQARRRSGALVARIDQRLIEARDAGVGENAAVRALGPPRTQLQQALAGNDRAAIERALTAATKATAQLEAAIAAAPKPAPEPLRALVGAFLGAKYADVARWDEVARLPDDRARAQAHLLRGAARWHLYVRDGEQDGKLRAAIDSDLREAKRLDRALKPNAQVFSPKLVERFAAL
jgi:hypothetical protein